MSQPVVIAGAGIAGLSAAVLLARQGQTVEVWEAQKSSGGLLAPVDFFGVPCDRGSHRIHMQADPLLQELTQEEDWQERPRRGMLVLNRQQIPYPPSPLSFLSGLGPRVSLSMGLSWVLDPGVWQRFLSWESDRTDTSDTDEGFESFVTSRVGQAAYHSFYRPYVEKVWGLPPSLISRTVAKQRVSTSSPWQTLLQALRPAEERQKQQYFLYPAAGMHGLLNNLLDKAEKAGVSIHYNQPLRLDNWPSDAKAVLYSGNLTSLAPESGLSHRGLYLLYCAFPKGTLPANDTWYTPETCYWFGRVSQPAQFSETLQTPEADVLCVEIPEGAWGDKLDFTRRQDELVQQLKNAGILPEKAALLGIRQEFLPHVYPLYRRQWYKDWAVAIESLRSLGNVFPFGRQGLFLHCNMDHCVRMASDVVEHIVRGGTSEEWLSQAERYLELRVRD